MAKTYTIIVTDTSPLITLSLAGELDILLKPDIQVYVPDAVYFEATQPRSKKGASRITGWFNQNLDRVHLVATETGVDRIRRLEEGRPVNGLGEAASLEVLDILLKKDPTGSAILIFEDSDIAKRRAVIDERVSLLSTGDFLRVLENAALIQSSDYILDKAAKAGRTVDRLRTDTVDEATKAKLNQQLSKRTFTS